MQTTAGCGSTWQGGPVRVREAHRQVGVFIQLNPVLGAMLNPHVTPPMKATSLGSRGWPSSAEAVACSPWSVSWARKLARLGASRVQSPGQLPSLD